MKKLLLFSVVFLVLKASSQPYLISFKGTGAITLVNSVKVENLTSGKSLTLNGSYVLNLSQTVDVHSIDYRVKPKIKIYPNPMSGSSVIQVISPGEGNVDITLFDMTGKSIAQSRSYMENALQEFSLSGLKSGIYLVRVRGNRFQYAQKVLCNGRGEGSVRIEKISNNESITGIKSKKGFNEGQIYVDMVYHTGERLRYTGISGAYSTIITDIPESDTTITFNFIPCTDGDNNNYPVVKIGNQIWMTENLKTTRFNNSFPIHHETDNLFWNGLKTPGYCWYKNNENAYKAVYGALYNWYAVNEGNLCPAGWHVPTDVEWTVLTDYLGDKGIAGGKLKSTDSTLWVTPNVGATNLTGFTALPGGSRSSGGAFDNTMKENGYWWSSTPNDSTTAWSRMMNYACNCVQIFDHDKSYGFSVRCIKDP